MINLDDSLDWFIHSNQLIRSLKPRQGRRASGVKSCVVTQNKTRRRRLEGSGPAAERKDTGSHINTFTALSIRLACCRFSFLFFFFFTWRVPFPCLTRNCCGDKVQIQLQGEFACIFPRLGNVLCIVFGFIRGCVFWRSFIVFLVAFACGATGKVLSDAEGSGKSVRIFCFYSSLEFWELWFLFPSALELHLQAHCIKPRVLSYWQKRNEMRSDWTPSSSGVITLEFVGMINKWIKDARWVKYKEGVVSYW